MYKQQLQVHVFAFSVQLASRYQLMKRVTFWAVQCRRAVVDTYIAMPMAVNPVGAQGREDATCLQLWI